MPKGIPTARPPGSVDFSSRRMYDRHRRDVDAKKFYNSAAWKRTRKAKLDLDQLCELCRPRVVVARHVHHKIELRDAPELGLVLSNLMSLCHSCHSRLHAERKRGKGGGG